MKRHATTRAVSPCGCASDAVAIMARADALTVEGASSAQLIEPSAVALLAAVRDHFQQPHCRTSKAKAPP